MDLEVEVAAGAGGIAGFADDPNRLALPEPLAAADRGRAGEVGVEIAAALAFAVDQDVVAVEDRVVAGLPDAPIADGYQPGAAASGDVKPFMDPPPIARRMKFPDRPSKPMSPLNRKDVPVIGSPTI